MTNNKTVVKAWIREQSKASRSGTLTVSLLGFLSVLFGILQGWELAKGLALILAQRKDGLKETILLFLLACLVRVALSALQEMAASRAGAQARRQLRRSILTRILAEGPALLRRQHSAQIAALIVDKVELLEGYFARWLPASALWVVAQWTIVAVLFWQNHRAGVILAACCAVLPVFQAIFGIATSVASRRQFLAMTRLQTRFLDRIKGVATIVLSGRAEDEARTLLSSAEELRRRSMKVLRVAFLTSATTDVAMIAALVLIVVSQSHGLVNQSSPDSITKALFAVFMVPEAFAPFRALSAAYQDRAHAAAAAEAMHDLAPAEARPAPAAAGSAPVVEAGGVALRFDHVTYRWDPARRPAVEDVSFALNAGEVLVLEGKSGAGKSTLIELILGFIAPEEGRILLGGVDMRQLSPAQIAPHLSWIGQNPVLFAGTLRENVLFARRDASEEALQNALSAASVTDYLSSLPHGLETRIGEGGYGLSGGQIQRLAIARAYLKNAPLLLLDEPTAHLDPETEAEILRSLEALSRGRSVVLSTHSDAMKRFGGQILHLNRGRVIAREGEKS